MAGQAAISNGWGNWGHDSWRRCRCHIGRPGRRGGGRTGGGGRRIGGGHGIAAGGHGRVITDKDPADQEEQCDQGGRQDQSPP
jgi:hypothetical protein